MNSIQVFVYYYLYISGTDNRYILKYVELITEQYHARVLENENVETVSLDVQKDCAISDLYSTPDVAVHFSTNHPIPAQYCPGYFCPIVELLTNYSRRLYPSV